MGQEKKYDVGIMGFWYGCNYGSIMTYYALNNVVASLGKSVLMLDKHIFVENDVERGATHSRRFAEEHYDISKQYRAEDLHELNNLCDTFLLGSDQTWNYWISKHFGKYFYFDFVDDDKKKLAYAVSFGQSEDHAPEKERRVISGLMSRMDGISVREEDGVRICCEDYGVKAKYVIDPVFLANPEIYKPLIEKSSHREEEPFIVTYILDPTPEKCEAARHIAKKLGGIKIISLLDGLPWKFKANKAKTTLPNCIENLQVEDWLYYLSHAEFVLTDSFHGSAFSIIFKRRFISLTNELRGLSRFKSLAGMFDFEDRLVEDPKRIMKDDSLMESLDYAKVDAVIEKERARCIEWLKTKLDEQKKSPEELDIKCSPLSKVITKNLNMKMCVGCGACMSACPKEAIKLEPDDMGYYRANVSYSKCVDCGICTKVCPAHHLPERKNEKKPKCYEFMAANEKTLMSSSSGGAFSVFAEEAFRRGGVVAGAAWRDKYSVEHILIDNKDELLKLKKSKYMQSYMGNIFRTIKNSLEDDKFVLFSGCPCQVAGLKKFLGIEYENLLLIDILCSHAPSAMFFRKYAQQAFPEGFKDFSFRTKAFGHDCISLEVVDNNGYIHLRHGRKEDDYERAFHSHTMCSKHCENCNFQEVPRYGDITIGDFWGLGKYDKVADAQKGVSVVLCNNAKGEAFLESLPSESVRLRKEVPLNWLGGNGFAINGSHNWINPKRDIFYDSIWKMPFKEALNYALKPNHGIYPKQDNNMPLGFDSHDISFSFDNKVWEEHRINGMTTLIVKQQITRPGVYATLPMAMPLKKGHKYILHTKFKARTTSEFLNFNLKDSGNMAQQVMHWHKTKGHGDKWVELRHEFIADSDLYDEIFFGASQLQGEGAYLMIDYLHIIERGNCQEFMNRAWDKVYELASQEMPWDKIRDILCNIDDIKTYLELLLFLAKKYTIIIAVKDTPGSRMSDDVMERMIALGFTNFSKELWRMYIGFLDAGKILLNQSGESRENPVLVQLEVPGSQDKFSITSKAWRQGNAAEIIINGVDYSANQRGINIVVYDKEKHEVWDSIGFDAHDNGVGFIRKNLK